MFPNLLKVVQVKCLKLLRIRLWVTVSTANQTQWSREPKPFKPIELEQALEDLAEAIGLMEDPR